MAPLTCALVAYVLAFAGCIAPPPATAPVPPEAIPPVTTAAPEDRTRLWQQDVDDFAALYHDQFAGAFALYPRAQFDQDIAALRSSVGTLSNACILTGLKRIAAKTQCGHAGVEAQRGDLLERRMPYQLRAFDDGVFIVQTDETHRELLGAEVLGVGGMDVTAALLVAASITPSESASWTTMRAPDQLCKGPTLECLGIVKDANHVPLRVRDRQGKERTVDFSQLPAGVWPTVPIARMDDPRAPRTWRDRKDWYGSDWLDKDQSVLYVWYDRCSDQPDHPVSAFATETLQLIDKSRPKRVILDLRRNSGGNSALLKPLIDGLAERAWLNRRDGLVVLMGATTFSSGAMNAEEMRRRTHATLVGTATGGRPGAWMEVRSTTLPNSLLRVAYMLRAPRFGPDSPPSFEPDVAVAVRIADVLEWRDPALARAQALPFAVPTIRPAAAPQSGGEK